MRCITPGTVLGFGLGGLLDGIVLHQVVQWHNLGSAVVPPVNLPAMQMNMRWDGAVHALAWTITFTGVWMLWGQRWAPTPSTFAGQLLFGWGAFNASEGFLLHHVLRLHHVRDLPVHVPAWDWLFLLGGGVALMTIGWRFATAPARHRAELWTSSKPPLQRRA